MTCFFLSASSLKRLNAVLSACPREVQAKLGECLLKGVTARVLAEHDRVGLQADRGRVHDLVGRALLEHTVLVDAGLVSERIAPDDGLVGLDRIAGEARDQTRGARDLAGDHARAQADIGLPGVQEHDDLLQGRVARALADPVDRALDLARAGHQSGERIGHGEPKIVVAVHGEHDIAQARHELVEPAQEGGELVGHRVAHGVGDVDRGGALRDRDRAYVGGVLDVGAGGVHGRELDVIDVLLGVGDRRPGLTLDVLARGLQLVADVDVGGGDERVDAWTRGVADRVVGGVDVGHVGPGQPGDHRALDRPGDRLHGLEVARRGDRKAGLDHIDAQARELLGDLQLLLGVERDARRLLAVAQRRVEDDDAVGVLDRIHVNVTPVQVSTGFFSVSVRLHAAAGALFPPRGEEKKSQVEAECHLGRQRSGVATSRAKRAIISPCAAS